MTEASLLWALVRPILPQRLAELPSGPSFEARAGELVLYLAGGGGDDDDDDHNGQQQWWWEAGVVATRPVHGMRPTADDLLPLPLPAPGSPGSTKMMTTTTMMMTSSDASFTVEMAVDPAAGADKTPSFRSAYRHVRHLRPLAYYGEVLAGVPREHWHASVHNALKAMASQAPSCKRRYRGKYPFASVLCQGMWVGSELIVVGDAIRVRLGGGGSGSNNHTNNNNENGDGEEHDDNDDDDDVGVMVVDRISVDVVFKDHDGRFREAGTQFSGPIFCARPNAYSAEAVDVGGPEWAQLPVSMRATSAATASATATEASVATTAATATTTWYRTHARDATGIVPIDSVVGRYYEPFAVEAWLGRPPRPTDGLAAIMAARDWASAQETRAPKIGGRWYRAEHRQQQLGLERFHRLPVKRGGPVEGISGGMQRRMLEQLRS